MSLSKNDRDEITNLIKVVVNGNIKRLDEKITAHTAESEARHQEIIDKIMPVLEGMQWLNTTKKITTLIAGIGAPLIVIYHWFVDK